MRCLSSLLLLAVLAPVTLPAAAERSYPPLGEVYSLLRSNLAGVSDAELNTAAVKGLLQQLGSRAVIETASTATNRGPALGLVTNHFGSIAHIRVNEVGAGLRAALDDAWGRLSSNGSPRGLVLDLRFATGGDYAAAVKAADKFVSAERVVLDWGAGPRRTTAKENAWKVPMAVLINEQTAGAAEALAAILRFTDTALLLGTNTAGVAGITRDFPLTNEFVLRVMTAPVTLGNGRVIPRQGQAPDIIVDVRPDLERMYLEDPYRVPGRAGVAGGAGDRQPRRRLTEADLVRMQRAGENVEDDVTSEPRPPSVPAGGPVIADPVLARAVDLLKGLAVVQRLR